jgi:hypothetical protein
MSMRLWQDRITVFSKTNRKGIQESFQAKYLHRFPQLVYSPGGRNLSASDTIQLCDAFSFFIVLLCGFHPYTRNSEIRRMQVLRNKSRLSLDVLILHSGRNRLLAGKELPIPKNEGYRLQVSIFRLGMTYLEVFNLQPETCNLFSKQFLMRAWRTHAHENGVIYSRGSGLQPRRRG